MSDLETGNMDRIRNLIASDGNRVDFTVSLQFDEDRYEWRTVNWSRFLYDKQENVYIPEDVFLEILSRRIDNATL